MNVCERVCVCACKGGWVGGWVSEFERIYLSVCVLGIRVHVLHHLYMTCNLFI